MPRVIDSHRTDLLDQVTATAVRRLGEQQGPALADFLRLYVRHVPPQDLAGQDPDNLFGAAFSHWRLAAQRSAGEPRIHVYNPRLDEHGWRSDHTVVEIVTDDMPFLVDSVTAELNRRDLIVHLVVHPVFSVVRDGEGTCLTVAGRNGGDGIPESWMHVEVNRQSEDAFADMAAAVLRILADVRAAVEDWAPMRRRLAEAIADIDGAGSPEAGADPEEVKAFLGWMDDDHFTFLGCRRYAVAATAGAAAARVEPDTGLGLLRPPQTLVFDDLRDGEPLPPALRSFVARPDVLMVAKSDRLATVHRSAQMDVVTVTIRNDDGATVGLHVFEGLFAAAAYNRSVRSIPLLRRKLNDLLASAGVDPRSHDGRALVNIVESFPRDELFQVDVEKLLSTVLGILHLQQRQRVALFVRVDDFERFVGCLVYVPRDRYDTGLRLRIQSLLERAFAGEVAAQNSQVGDAPLARLHVIVRTAPGRIPAYDVDHLEAQIVDAARTWPDRLRSALLAAHGEERGHRLADRYADAFPAGYADRFNADEAVADIDTIETTLATGGLGKLLYRPFRGADNSMRLKLYQCDQPIVLSNALPRLEHLGLRVVDEVPIDIRVRGGGGHTVFIHDFGVETSDGSAIDIGLVRDRFQEALLAVWTGEIESDLFNALVLRAGLTWREVMMVRAYARFLRQTGVAFSQAYMQQTLAANAALARLIVDLFLARFDPARSAVSEARRQAIREALDKGLEAVTGADEDRILRRFINAVEATLRTNYFQRTADGAPRPYLALKLDSRRLDDLPPPRPMVEVFVYSPRMEGIHLRGGRVARGGIRWSDRREDFRTEILGLMKAQMVKNTVIVPVGAKGGFVVKRPPDGGDREAVMAEGVACYQTLIRGLLDVTDNRVGPAVVPPADVVRVDDDDPYLVVAADKGTATFSDIANAIAADYGFWLGDAFASGGSVGYDHKKMGITARGAWVSVQRHFRDLGRDIRSESFTAIGVGDMAGDVFGNGMLLAPQMRLFAAFNHAHIFVDPDPDPTLSFAERQRLFGLPRSSWADYDPNVLSKGGAVFDRRAKWVAVSPEIRSRFGFTNERMTPTELIRRLLTADVDLLWLGGIGTFVKAAHESHADAGDRANDAIRVDADDLRCKVIGEGANLGITQLGRVAFALTGGRINTDFIDNSAGVDCSDHEVNIKILLDAVVADGDMTDKQRNVLLADMTDEVAHLVLRDNYLQTQGISVIEAEGAAALEGQGRLIRFLERHGSLNRTVEFLPEEEALAERTAARQALTRPEIAVVFSHVKIWLYDQILVSDLPDDPHLAVDLQRYFPSAIQERFRDRVFDHRLKRELVATAVTNSIINRVGGRFLIGLAEKTGRSPADVTRAYLATRAVHSVRGMWDAIEALDYRVPSAMQTTLFGHVRSLLERGTLWFLRHGGSPLDVAALVAELREPVSALAAGIGALAPATIAARLDELAAGYRQQGVDDDLARRIADIEVLPAACDIVRLAARHGLAIETVARLHFAVGERFGFGWLRGRAEALPGTGYWDKLAVAAIVDELDTHQRRVTEHVLAARIGDGVEAIDAWAEDRKPAVDRLSGLLGELETARPVDLAMLTVVGRELGALAAT